MNGSNSSADQAAAVWMTRRDAGWSAAEQAEFQAWIEASPTHALAWAKVDAAWQLLDRPRYDGLAETFAQQLAVRQRQRRIRRYVLGTTGLAAAAALTLLFLPPVERAKDAVARVAPPPVVRSPQQILPDGSVVDLNRDSEIVVEYDAERRRVRLVRGEAHFEVKSDTARPFVVTAGGVDVRAVGTAFAVRLDAAAVDVLVTHGRVAVARPTEAGGAPNPMSAPAVTLSAGLRLSLPTTAEILSPQPEALSEAEIARRLHWRHPRLALSGTTLADAIAMLNQQNTVRVTIADAELAQLRMSGVFRLDDIEGFVDVLATNYGVASERSGNEIVLRQKAKR